ncbi:hypothetical protein ACFX5F_14770 [Flavobacterium sp. ZS1P70]|uniref:Uncharacterized protein n=1 Tax=Flavobacterium zhoui TaxID=3230414 RepID=A0ABW6I977_9FLAO
MNINQKQIVQDSLEAIKSTDIEQHLIAAYPTEADFSKINISKYSAAEFLFLFNKMISQLEELIENIKTLKNQINQLGWSLDYHSKHNLPSYSLKSK